MSNEQGIAQLLNQPLDYFKVKPVNISKITILLDHGYCPDNLIAALQTICSQMMSAFELAPKPTQAEKAARG